jgi:hypothetical protein
MGKIDKEEEREKYESYFLNDGAINFILKMGKDAWKSQLKEAKKYCDIPAKDTKDLLNQLREPDFLSVERSSSWEFSSLQTLNYDGKVNNFGCCRANFDLVNKWGYKSPYRYFQLVYSDDFFVVWLGYILIGGPIYWISVDNSVYRMIYLHKKLRLYPNVCNEPEPVAGLDPQSLDNVVKKHHKKLRYFDPNFKMLEHTSGYKTIELDDCFKKGFFYKGPKYNYDEYKKVNYYAWIQPWDTTKKEISNLKDLKAENGLFKVEIENETYPHSGYAYLDLAELKIVRTEII